MSTAASIVPNASDRPRWQATVQNESLSDHFPFGFGRAAERPRQLTANRLAHAHLDVEGWNKNERGRVSGETSAQLLLRGMNVTGVRHEPQRQREDGATTWCDARIQVGAHVLHSVSLVPVCSQIRRDVACAEPELIVEFEERESRSLRERTTDRRLAGAGGTNQVNRATHGHVCWPGYYRRGDAARLDEPRVNSRVVAQGPSLSSSALG